MKNPLSAKGREGARRTPLSTMGRLGREFEGTHKGCPYGDGRWVCEGRRSLLACGFGHPRGVPLRVTGIGIIWPQAVGVRKWG